MAAVQFVYLHGQPGGPEELTLARPDGWTGAANVFAPDRALDRPDLALGPYLDHLAASILRRFPEGPIRLVGFSLGGFVATEIALRLGESGRADDLSLDLISTAAPLGYGDFLPHMAGGRVFALAQAQPWLFNLMTQVQGGLAAWAPKMLFGQIFAGAAGADADLARDPAFQASLQGMIAHSLAKGARGYRRDIGGYVAQTPERLVTLRVPITLWCGEADTWAPPGMSHAIAQARSETRRVRPLPEHSHYSTLAVALPQIFRDLA
jgi:pimeloyl-ACP methyl ester carboxylesterase